MKIVKDIAALRVEIGALRAAGTRVGLVPTMGALHEGHLSLVRETRKHADRVVVSIFVNPAQFAPHEDFERYPRDLKSDCAKLSSGGVDLVFAPSTEEMYPEGFATRLEVGGPSAGLETDFRPHFFGGVATVVMKLLLAATPDVTTFGEKDYQQLLVIRRLARDLALRVDIVGAPIVREPDGLAMSSRNAYLSAHDRTVGGQLNRVLKDVIARANRTPISTLESDGAKALRDAGFDAVDYVAIRDAETLAPIGAFTRPARILAAARVGGTRLIDNMPVGPAA